MISKVLSFFIFPALLPLGFTANTNLQERLSLQAQVAIEKPNRAPWINLLDSNLSQWELT